jgi:hypothetical protein
MRLRLQTTDRGAAFVAQNDPPRRQRRWYASIGGLMGSTALLAVVLTLHLSALRTGIDLRTLTFDEIGNAIMWVFYETVALYYVAVVPAWFLRTRRSEQADSREAENASRHRPSWTRSLRMFETEVTGSPLLLYGPLVLALGLPWVVGIVMLVIVPTASAAWEWFSRL